MKLVARVIIFGILFSIMFFWIRHIDLIPMHLLLAETDGIGLLYSAIGLIFGIISAFVIQTQWDNWDKLVISVHGEIKSLRQLLLFSRYISPKNRGIIKNNIIEYIREINNKWNLDESKHFSNGTIKPMQELQESIYSQWKEKPLVTESANQIILRILGYHDDIIHYSSRRLPVIVRILIMFSMILVIFLPLFIGVRTLWLDYIITVSIAVLAFLIFTVISDLDNPLKPGNWHITSSDYKTLLREITKN